MLLALGRYRILSFAQLRRAVFPDLSAQRVGQRLHALAANGWLRVWEDVSRIGGRPRYALPTRRALTLAMDLLHAASIGQASERLASLTLRGRPRRPINLAPRVTPAFLAHQRECNDLLLAYARIPGARLLWSTSFDRPFPLYVRGIQLPQPDSVLVLERGGTPASSSASTIAGTNRSHTFGERRPNATPRSRRGLISRWSSSASHGSWCG